MRTRSLRLVPHALVAIVVALQCAVPLPAAGQGRSHQEIGAAPPLEKAATGSPGKNTAPSHVVNEGGVERPLWIDTTRVADFDAAGGGRPAVRAAAPGELIGNPNERPGAKSGVTTPPVTPAGGAADGAAGANTVSPILLDASGRARALPGGVIVSLKQALPDGQAREQLLAAGLEPLRRIGERMWLVQSPVGLPSLELANRLQAEGSFEFAQPNWWHPRTTK